MRNVEADLARRCGNINFERLAFESPQIDLVFGVFDEYVDIAERQAEKLFFSLRSR